MIFETTEKNGLFNVYFGGKLLLETSDINRFHNNLANIRFGNGVRQQLEQKLEFDKVVALLRNSDLKQKDSKYNPFTKGCVECDLAIYPKDQEGFQYAFTFVDIKTRMIFVHYAKSKDSEETVRALQKAYYFYEGNINVLCFDKGAEFYNNIVKNWCNINKIAIDYGITNRRFNGIVESYIGFIKKYVNEKLGLNQLKNIANWNNWRNIMEEVVQIINQHNKNNYPKKFNLDYRHVENSQPLFKNNDMVHVKLDYPADILTSQRVHGVFRYGDLHFSKETYPITKIILRENDSEPRYKIAKPGSEKTSFKKDELLLKVM